MIFLLFQLNSYLNRLASGDTVGVREELKTLVARAPGSPEAARALLWLEVLGTGDPLPFFKALKLLGEGKPDSVLSLEAGDTASSKFLEVLKAKALAGLGDKGGALRLLGEVSKGRGLAAAWAAWEAWELSGSEEFLKDLVRRFPKTGYGALAREVLERE